jgi:hypothetical protein
MEEVIGSIPIRSTKSFQILTGEIWEQVTPAWELCGNTSLLASHLWRFPIRIGAFAAQQMIDCPLLRVPFLVHPGVRVHLHRRTQFGVAHEFLHHPHIVPGMRQERAVGMPKGMPADPLGDPDRLAATPNFSPERNTTACHSDHNSNGGCMVMRV